MEELGAICALPAHKWIEEEPDAVASDAGGLPWSQRGRVFKICLLFMIFLVTSKPMAF